MNILRFSNSPSAKLDTALLIKQDLVTSLNKVELSTSYFIDIGKHAQEKIGNRVSVIGTYHPKTGKVKKADIKLFTQDILDYCDTQGIDKLLIADAEYFKYLSGAKVFEKHIGEIFNCPLNGYEHIKITPMVNYTAVNMFPEKKPLLDLCNKTAGAMMSGKTLDKQEFEFNSYELITTLDELEDKLITISDDDTIALDIETTGLHLDHAEVLTLGIATSKYDAFTIAVHDHYGDLPIDQMIDMLKAFFKRHKGRRLFHNGLFDVKHLVYNWYMEDFTDVDGMIEGINDLHFDDTFILAYLKLNSTVRPNLGLKDLTYDFLGDYAEDVKQAINVPLEDLAIYNAKDCCGTFYVYEQFKDALSFDVYNTIMKPSYRPLLKMMLNGMPLNLDRVAEVRKLLEDGLNTAQAALNSNEYVKLTVRQLRLDASEKYNKTHKTVKKTPGDFMDVKFNPNSTNQLRLLLFDIMGFEPIEYTSTGQSSTNRATIKELLETAEIDKKPALEALVTISQAGIVLNTFISAFEEMSITQAVDGDGSVDYTTLHGSLKLGGTQSGRLSSSDPEYRALVA